MKVLLDTHIIIWAALNDTRLSEKAKDIIVNPDNEIYYSTASVWEITIKHMARPGKMRYNGDYLAEECDKHGYCVLPIENKHVSALATLKRGEDAPAHNDPFDRIMLAQAKAEDMAFVTHDSLLTFYNEDYIIFV